MEKIQIRQFLYEFFLLCGKYGVNFHNMVFIADSEIYRYEKNSDGNFVLYNNDEVTLIDLTDYHFLTIDKFTEALTGVNSDDCGYDGLDYDDVDYSDDIDFC